MATSLLAVPAPVMETREAEALVKVVMIAVVRAAITLNVRVVTAPDGASRVVAKALFTAPTEAIRPAQTAAAILIVPFVTARESFGIDAVGLSFQA